PVSVCSLQPATPMDIETICLKCLHKEPGRRYGTAQELAEDLERFRTGLPVHARPVRRLERAAKWVRRNPAVASLAAAVALVLALGTTVSIILAIVAGEKAALATLNAKEAKDNERK